MQRHGFNSRGAWGTGLLGLLAAAGCGNVCVDDGFVWQQGDNAACMVQPTSGESTGPGGATDEPTTSDPTNASETEPPAETTAATSTGEGDTDPTGETTGDPESWCADADADGFGDPTMCQPDMFPGSVPNAGDCADDNASAFPGAADKESMDACMEDADDDGYGDDAPPPGVEPGTDCNDDNATIYPDAASLDLPGQCAQDSDGDGYGDSTPDDPEVPPGTDCADDDAATFLGAAPNDDPAACMTDADGDDWGDDTPTAPAAVPGTDCDDSSVTTFPGSAPNDGPDACHKDDDDDDWGDDMPPEGVTPGTDCNDAAAEVWVDCADCTPNELVCVDKDLQVCNDTGTGAELMACEYGCDDEGLACWPQLTVSAGDNACIDMGAQFQLQAEVAGGDGMYTYAWAPAMTLDDAMIADPKATPTGATTYTVNVADGEGNMASDDVTVYVKNQALELDPEQCTTHDYPLEPEDAPTKWVWNEAEKELCQTVNGRGSVLFCGWDLDDATIDGTFSVNTVSDDDFTGFIWGVQDLDHYYIFTWKQAEQFWTDECGVLPRGMQVKVIDVQDPMNDPLSCADVHAPKDTPNSKLLLAVDDFSTAGWADNTDYKFELTHKAGGEMTIVIRQVNNMQIIAQKTFNDTTYAKGKFGMYTNSQEQACFSDFTVSCIP